MRFSYIAYPLPEETEEDSGGDGGADDSGDVRSHRVHQKVVVRVELPADDLGDTRAVRNGGHSGVAYERIDLAVTLQEDVPDLDEEYAAGCGDHE